MKDRHFLSTMVIRLAHLLRYAWSDLRHRWGATTLNIVAVALANGYLLVLGAYGVGIYQHQRDLLDENLVTAVVATTTDIADRQMSFTPERLKELANRPHIAEAFPHVELTVRLAHGGGPARDVTAEGTTQTDPAFANRRRLLWGAGVSSDEAREILLSQALFEKLGGRLTPSGPSPQMLTVQVARGEAGREQVQRLDVSVRGILQPQTSEKAYLPVQLVHALDQWCMHRLDDVLPGDHPVASGTITYPLCHAYVPREQVERVDAEARNLRLAIQRAEEFVTREGTRLVRYEVRDPAHAERHVTAALVSTLNLARPTFVAARPDLDVGGELDNKELRFRASDPSDPGQFRRRLTAGTWLTANAERQIVLPHERVAGHPDLVPGRSIPVRFRQPIALGGETMTMTLSLVGVTEGTEAVIPLALATKIERWQRGKCVFDEKRQIFETPRELAQRAGFVRARFYASDPEKVAAVVADLQALGYRTDDRLAEQQGLRRLGRLLVFVIGFFVFGCVFNSAITMWISTLMNVKSKTWEIGILRANGAGSGWILAVFGAQGLLVGMAAYAVAAGLVAALEPALRSGVCQVFGHRQGLILSRSPFDLTLWWLPVLVLVVSLGCSLLGVLFPAGFACRLSPVEALRRRE